MFSKHKEAIEIVLKPVTVTRLMLLKITTISAAIGCILTLLSGAIGVVLSIIGGLLLFAEIYNAVVGGREIRAKEIEPSGY